MQTDQIPTNWRILPAFGHGDFTEVPVGLTFSNFLRTVGEYGRDRRLVRLGQRGGNRPAGLFGARTQKALRRIVSERG